MTAKRRAACARQRLQHLHPRPDRLARWPSWRSCCCHIDQNTLDLLTFYDNAICVIFLADFAYNITGARPRRAYFVGQRGWLDLLGSISTLGVFQLTALFRLARLSRLARITQAAARQATARSSSEDVVQNRGQYATFITLLPAGSSSACPSVIVLQVEGRSAASNITTPGDAIWWGFVTDHDGRLRRLLPGDGARARPWVSC